MAGGYGCSAFFRKGRLSSSFVGNSLRLLLKSNRKNIYMMKFKRILLKLSGESLMGEQGHGIDVKRLN